MFHRARNIIFFILFLGVVGIGCTQIPLQSYIQNVDNQALFFDYFLAQETQQSITRYFKDACQNHTVAMSKICVYMKDAFPYINTIAISLLPNRLMHVEIKVHKPQYMVNNTHVLINNGLLAYKEIFTQQIIHTLHHVSINLPEENRQYIPQSAQKCLEHVTPYLFNHYKLFWQDAYFVWLCDKKYPCFAILFHQESVPDTELLHHCNSIKQQLIDRGVFDQKNKKIWIADVRFADQIVVYAKKKGGKHGTNMF